MAKLYPPIIEEIIPAFYGAGGLSVPYTINRAVGLGDIAGFALIVKSSITNKEIFTTKDTSGIVSTTISKGSSLSGVITFSINDLSKFKTGGWYKIQIAFIDQDNEVGYFSNASLVKYIGINKPLLSVSYSNNSSENFMGLYQCEDITEKMSSYKFTLYDNNNNIIEESGELLHDTTADVGLKQKQPWTIKRVLDNGANYSIQFEVTTINHLTLSTTEVITAHKDPEGYIPQGIKIDASVNSDEGYVQLKISPTITNDTKELIYGKFEIFKTSSKDNYQSKYRVAYFELQNQDLYEKIFKDFTVESGYSYKYILQQKNNYGIYSEEVVSNNGEPIKVFYEHIFLFDGKKQLKIAYNPKVQSFKDTVLEQKVDTIGSKYPFIFRNNTVKYKEIPISGLISYNLDPENLFLEDYEIWNDMKPDLDGQYRSKESWKLAHWTHNLEDDNVAAEREFKLRVMEWLEDGKPKLFKSPTEGNYILRLMNVSLSPVDTVGRMLHSFSATGYEIEDASTYSFADILQLDSSSKYIGYRTIPLYDFPSFYYVSKNTIIPNLNKYEIIGDVGLEWVIGFTIEDVKPGTQFDVTVERGIEKSILHLRIGATGTYYFPQSLGYHVTSIKLYNSQWNTGDYRFDAINNRGQVTYVYERQAKHNNFNDITKISLTREISYPLISSWFKNIEFNQQLISANGKPLYEFKTTSYKEPAFFQMGYFYCKDNSLEKQLLVNSIDYYFDKDDGKYYLKTNNDNPKTELKLVTPEEEQQRYDSLVSNGSLTDEEKGYFSKTCGCKKDIGQPIYRYEKIMQPLSNKELTDNTTMQDSEITLFAGKKYYTQLYNKNFTNFFSDSVQYVYKDNFIENDEEQLISFKISNNISDVNIFRKATNSSGNVIIEKTVTEQIHYENPFYVKIYTTDFDNEQTQTNNDQTQTNNIDIEFLKYDWNDLVLKMLSPNSEQTNISLFDLTNNYLYNTLQQISSAYFVTDNKNNVFLNQNLNQIVDSKIKALFDDTSGEQTEFLKNLIYKVFIKSIDKYALSTSLKTLEPLYANRLQVNKDNIADNITPLMLQMPKNIIQEKYYGLKNIIGDYYKKQENVHLYSMDFELIQVFYDEDLKSTKQNYTYDGGYVSLKDTNEDGGYQKTERIIEVEDSYPVELRNDKVSRGNSQNYYLASSERFADKIVYNQNTGDENTNKTFNDFITDHFVISFSEIQEQFNNNNSNLGDSSTLSFKDILFYLYDIDENKLTSELFNNNILEYIYSDPNIDIFTINHLTSIEGASAYNLVNTNEEMLKVRNIIYPSSNENNIDNNSSNENTLTMDDCFLNLQAQCLKKYCERVSPKPNEIVIVLTDDLSDVIKIDLTNRFSYHLDFDNESWNNVEGIYLGENVRGFLTFDRKRYAYNAIAADGANIVLDYEDN